MLNHNIPAGNHIVKSVQYDSASNNTKLTLCCGLMAYMTLADTQLYKPEVGDYYIVTDHGTASLVKKAVWEADIRKGMEDAGLIAKKETLGMREENGYVDKVKKPESQLKDKTKDVITPEGFGVLPEHRSAALLYAEYYASEKWIQLQNVIKSLIAQNAKKQEQMSRQAATIRNAVTKRTNPVSINREGTVTVTRGHLNVHDFGFSTNGPAHADDYHAAIMSWIDKQHKA